MDAPTARSAKEGILFGLVAGIIFAIVEIAVAAMMGLSPLRPLRLFSSVVLGQSGLEAASQATAVGVGTIVHLLLSAGFGLIYGLINARLSTHTQVSWSRQAGVGMLFGAALWLINFQIIARIVYPWFLATPQLAQLLMHALAFGLPLGVMYAAAERRVHHLRGAARPI